MASDHRSRADLDPRPGLDGEVVDCGPASLWPGPGPRANSGEPVSVPAAGPWPPGAYVRLAAGVRLAVASGEVVALDLRRDRYFGLGPEASRAVYDLATLQSRLDGPPAALQPVVRACLLVPVDRAPGTFRIAEPREPGGVRTRSLLSDDDDAPPPATMGSATRTLMARKLILSCDRLLNARGLAALFRRLRAAADGTRWSPPTPADRGRLKSLVLVHERAWLLTGRPRPEQRSQTTAAALALHAWRAGLPARVVLGVQKYPFYARMWVESHGEVVGGAADLSDRLAPLLSVATDGGKEARTR
jgi:hypothetical protein